MCLVHFLNGHSQSLKGTEKPTIELSFLSIMTSFSRVAKWLFNTSRRLLHLTPKHPHPIMSSYKTENCVNCTRCTWEKHWNSTFPMSHVCEFCSQPGFAMLFSSNILWSLFDKIHSPLDAVYRKSYQYLLKSRPVHNVWKLLKLSHLNVWNFGIFHQFLSN